MKYLLPIILLISACEDSTDRETFYDECFSEDTVNENIRLVQQGQVVCPNLDDVLANCEGDDSDFETDADTCEVTFEATCTEGYRYRVVLREYAVKLEIDSPDFACDTNGFEPYTNY